LCNLGIPSPYWTIAFPNEPPQCSEYFELDGLSPAAQRRWQQALARFLKQLTWKRPGRLVLKSPPHTFRLPTLQRMFPQARYIHLVRNPYDVFASTLRLWKSLYAAQGYQRPTYAGLEEQVLHLFCRLYQRLEATREVIDPRRFCDLRYEDLIADPTGQLRQVYRQLDLGDFEPMVPAIAAYLRQRTEYRPNRHELAPHQHAVLTQRWLPHLKKYGYDADGS
jgi:omega-hydroxy-beta-dihydromenaquinone-9 sulfotransferase